MENVTQKILGLLDQAQGLILQAKEVLVASVSEPMPENLEGADVATTEVPENPEAINTAIEEGAADLTPAETATDPDPISTEGEIGSQE